MNVAVKSDSQQELDTQVSVNQNFRTNEQNDALKVCLAKLQHCISQHDLDLGRVTSIRHSIKLKDETLFKRRHYMMK